MRKNYVQDNSRKADNRTYVEGDWYPNGIPSNVHLAKNVFIDTSYGFTGFYSSEPDALFIDEASGCYDHASFIVSKSGRITVGKFCILNGCTIICNEHITIGNHCMLAWGAVITDNWIGTKTSAQRGNILYDVALDTGRKFPFVSSMPVIIEDNVWIGFDAVVMPGVKLERGCVVACKTIVDKDVPSYAVIGGSPARIIKYLDPDDTFEVRDAFMKNIKIA